MSFTFPSTDSTSSQAFKVKNDSVTAEDKEETPGSACFVVGRSIFSQTNKSLVRNRASREETKVDAAPVPVFGGLSFSTPLLETPWRNVTWTKEAKEALMDMVKSYKPPKSNLLESRVLLLGPVGAGKSSFISSVQSVFSGRVLNRAMVGSSTSTSFTKKLQSFKISAGCDSTTALVLCDLMGFGEGEASGLTLHDALSVIQGHVPEGHQFSPEQPVKSETPGFINKPRLEEKVHCVVFVVDASKLKNYPKGLSTTFRNLREHISNMGVHQVALLTHVDEVCKETAQDVTCVYKSPIIQQLMATAGTLLGMAVSYIVPVRNYSSQLQLDESCDILLLNAVDHILQYVNLYFQDSLSTYRPLAL
ncbi:interferon-induced protein 44 isoform X2 [Hoplias malabaricus]|uniref:interferon-induced protein 44 isoform X2 n=1 Tax=Hoplias malabaricus TaxID=27720 RepID=UPI0034623CD3